MFRVKAKNDRTRRSGTNTAVLLTIQNPSGEVLFEGSMMDFQFPEDIILMLSIEYFNDPAPCYIHRGAVAFRLIAEIEEAVATGTVVALAALPPHIKRYFGHYPDQSTILLS